MSIYNENVSSRTLKLSVLTQERRKQEFLDKLSISKNKRFELISDFTNSTTKVKFCCNICNYVFDATPGAVLHDNRICDCNRKNRILNDFRSFLAETFPSYFIEGEYFNSVSSVTIHCGTCDLTFVTRPDTLKKLNAVKQCLCYEKELCDIKTKLIQVKYPTFKVTNVLSKHDHKPVSVICIGCNHQFSESVNSLMHKDRQRGCICRPVKDTITTEFEQQLALTNPSLRLVGDLEIASNRKSTYECIECGDRFKAHKSNVLTWKRKCSCASARRHLEFVKKLEISQPNFQILDTYKGNEHQYRFNCTKCGDEFVRSGGTGILTYGHCCSCNEVAPIPKRGGRKTSLYGFVFDSKFEAQCAEKIIHRYGLDNIQFKKRYPNTRKKCDFYIPSVDLWIEVSRFTHEEYINKIESKRSLVSNFIFINTDRQLRAFVGLPLKPNVNDLNITKEEFLKKLSDHNGNKSALARELQISRSLVRGLDNKFKKVTQFDTSPL